MNLGERTVCALTLGVLGISSWLSSGTIRYRRWCDRPRRTGPADVLIVLGIRLTPTGGAHFLLRERVEMAHRLLLDFPTASVLLTGGNPRAGITEADRMQQLARRRGIPEHRLVIEPRARTTEENAQFSADVMQQRGWGRGLVISHRLHLGYAIPVFEDAFQPRGLEVFWQPVDDRMPLQSVSNL